MDKIKIIREALEEIRSLPNAEINTNNYNHDNVCELNEASIKAFQIATKALQALAELEQQELSKQFSSKMTLEMMAEDYRKCMQIVGLMGTGKQLSSYFTEPSIQPNEPLLEQVNANANTDNARGGSPEQPINSGSEGLIKEIEKMQSECFNTDLPCPICELLSKCKAVLSQVKPSVAEVSELQIYKRALESISKNGCCDKCQEAKVVAEYALKQALTTNGTKHY